MKHTPGPWQVDELMLGGKSFGVSGVVCSDENVIHYKDEGWATNTIAVFSNHGRGLRTNNPEVVANMHLIAAAPDMKETLAENTKVMKTMWCNGVTGWQVDEVLVLLKEMIFKNETLLKKAKGEE